MILYIKYAPAINSCIITYLFFLFFFFQAEDGIRDGHVTGVQTCALPISPTLIRSLISWQKSGTLDLEKYDLSSVRLLGSVGEPINPAVWQWFQENIGSGIAPIIDTWWQSETGATVIAHLPGESLGTPGAAGRPLPGFDVKIVGPDGTEVPAGATGKVAITHPWPGMARNDWGGHVRYLIS